MRKFARPMVLALLLSLVPLGNAVVAAPSTLVVDDDGFATATNCNDPLTPAFLLISAAEAVAIPGDTIQVCPGFYNEQVQIRVSQPTLLGAQAGFDAAIRVTTPAASRSQKHLWTLQIRTRSNARGFTIQGRPADPAYFRAWTIPVSAAPKAVTRSSTTSFRTKSPERTRSTA